MSSLILPTAYLGGCIVTMSVFSYVYRRAKNVRTIEPWFPPNDAKEKYIALLNAEPAVPDHHLKSALLGRAMEGVRRVVAVQQEKPALGLLLRTGHIGDEIWQDFQVAEKETMHELQEIAQEANTFKEGWSKTLFTTASQMIEAEKQKEIRDRSNVRRAEEEEKKKPKQCECLEPEDKDAK
ncbi:Sec62/63 complex, subunit Sec66 [Dichotomocladium elegans]|nr:Sec62/63 complex, subunit Sec66 [Dichotomocladium elegans]